MFVYVMFDKPADKFSDPFISENDKTAIRMCKRSIPSEWSDDFAIYRLCEFTDPHYIKRADIVSQEVPFEF